MDPCRLTRDELEYEMRVRGIKNISSLSVAEMRKGLTSRLKKETLGTLISEPIEPLDSIEEILICTQKIVEMETAMAEAQKPLDSSELKKYGSRVGHLYSRLARVITEDPKVVIDKENLRTRLETIEQQILDKEAISDTLSSTLTIQSPLTPSVNTPSPRQTPVVKWNLIFSGDDNEMSVNAFIERVEEYRISRNVSEIELFNSAVELFRGNALIWFRANKNKISNWAELVVLLRAEYEPHDYELELWKEIRSRTQGVDEKVGSFFACLENLFARLPTPATETQKLQVLRRNIAPYYIYGIGLADIHTVDQLLLVCKRLEANRYMAEKFQPPPSNKRSLLEPDLAYQNRPRSSRVNTVSQSDSSPKHSNDARCWNCASNGHKFSQCRLPRNKFCFRCGFKDVTKFNCPKCQSKNV